MGVPVRLSLVANQEGWCPYFNVEAWLTENGSVVPGSRRIRKHNVFTRTGRDWLAKLISWQLLGDVSGVLGTEDTEYTIDRVRWIGVGTGTQAPLIDVQRIVTAAPISTNVYLATVGAPTFDLPTSAKFAHTFAIGSFTDLGATADISEAGLVVDSDPSLTYGVADDDALVVAYIPFGPLTVTTAAQALTITWELRF